MQISSNFDSGSIIAVACHDPLDIRLNLREDNRRDVLQWFHFRLTGAKGIEVRLCITNAKDATYNDWEGYQAFASHDRDNWFRVPTTYQHGELRIAHTPEHDSLFYALFEPYSHDRHLHFIHQSQLSPHGRADVIGQSVEGRDLDLLVIGNEANPRTRIWFIARQHPGEPQAEWFIEGLVKHLLDDDREGSRFLREEAVFYCVPNMNPDGAILGNQRTNVEGSNLNRVWDNPSERYEPEVFQVRRKILDTGTDLFFDIHGEEAIPYVFLCGSEGNPSYTERQEAAENRFCQLLLETSPDFQTEHGYGKDEPNPKNLALASNWAADQFDCLAMTLEMPFKDNQHNPIPATGWTAGRSKQFAGEFLQAIERFLRE